LFCSFFHLFIYPCLLHLPLYFSLVILFSTWCCVVRYTTDIWLEPGTYWLLSCLLWTKKVQYRVHKIHPSECIHIASCFCSCLTDCT
jgi:hypothetical protein